jgi:pyruvate dehydrogenase E2 component (dihydrolipoamide acetyltransferase)
LARLQASVAQGKRHRHHFIALGPAEATPIVLLHGFLGDMFSWQYCMVPLTRHGRVIALDLPGHGLSHEVEVGGLDRMADWLEDALDALGIDACHLVAHSFGAWIALQTALRHPQRVRSLCLVACAGLDRQFNFAMLRAALEVNDEAGALRFAQALAGDASGAAAQFAQRHLALLADGARRRTLQRMLDDMIRAVAAELPAGIDWPTLRPAVKFLWSGNDAIVPMPGPHAFPLGAEISMRDDGGHVPHITAPGWVNDEIARFLASSTERSA